MAKSVFDSPVQSANLGHYTHPMRQRKKFSSTVGEIRPLYFDFLYPNESIKGTVNVTTLMEQLKNPSFVDLETCIDAFFVPIEQLYNFFKQQYFGVKDFHTSLIPDDEVFGMGFPTWSFHGNISDTVMRNSFLGRLMIDNPNTFYSNFYPTEGSELSPAVVYDRIRLMDALEFPVVKFQSAFVNDSSIKDTEQSLWFPLAYQKIFADVYRITDIEEQNAAFFNVDDAYNTQISELSRLKGIFQMRYVPYRLDYFTHWFTSPFVPTSGTGTANFLSLLNEVDFQPRYTGNNQNGASVNSADDLRTDAIYGAINDRWSVTDPSSGNHYAAATNITPQNIRAMFAMEKVAEVTRRAAKHIDAQTLAHFGVDGNPQLAGHVVRLGHWSSIVNMEMKSSQAAGIAGYDGSTPIIEPLGTLAGTGSGYVETTSKCGPGNEIYYKTGENFGVFMVVMYTRPIVDYYQTGLSPLSQLTSTDRFFRPEYGNLGMIPMYAYNANYHPETSQNDDYVVAWQYRDWSFKVKPDLVYGQFLGVYRDWTIGRTPLRVGGNTDILKPTAWRYVRYVNPTDLDSIMEHRFESNPFTSTGERDFSYSKLYMYDPMKHRSTAEFVKTSLMPTFGLPDL